MDPRLSRTSQASSGASQQQRGAYGYQQQNQQQQYLQASSGQSRPSSSQQQSMGGSKPADPREQRRQHQQMMQPSGSSAGQQGDPSKSSQQRPSGQRRPQMQKPSGPPKRNPQLQEPDPDGFHPRYELSYLHPHVPVKPKLFTYRLNTDDAASRYEFSTVELNQQHQLLVDYSMGMRVDLVDKEKYQLHPTPQLAALVGLSKKDTGAEQFTQKMLDDLKQRLLSSRDKFILSNKETLPEFEPPAQGQPKMLSKIPSMMSDGGSKPARRDTNQGSSKILTATAGEPPVLSGQDKRRDEAIRQIEATFEQAKRFKPGCAKLDSCGRPIAGVTAAKVMDVLPMKHAELLELSMVVNDDDLDRQAHAAGSLNNGHLLHLFRDKQGEPRQAFYSHQAQEDMPGDVAGMICGKKRTHGEYVAQQLQHVRDYAFTEQRGGTKGEAADYILYQTAAGDALAYAPITSKIKLNKKRKATLHSQADGEQNPAAKTDVSHIVIAARNYSRDEEKGLNTMMARCGTKDLKVSAKAVSFESKDDLKNADLRVTDLLKEMFRQHLPQLTQGEGVPSQEGGDSDGEDNIF